MHLIFCIDDRDGISFCGRRLSRDSALNEHILRLSAGHILWMNHDSSKLFPEDTVVADADFLCKAGPGDYCLVETTPVPDTLENLESVILYHWNRSYPSTVKFPRELLSGMRLVHTEYFPGNSHEKITMERYTL